LTFPASTSRSQRLLVILGVVVVVAAVGAFGMYQFGPGSLDRRIDSAFEELDLPPAFTPIDTVEKRHEGDLTTDALTARARTYRVATSMQQARDDIRTALLRERDPDVAEHDRRLSMHATSGQFGIEDRALTCSPVQIPLRSNTFATVVFGETPDSVRVGLDEDGQVTGLDADSGSPNAYVRQSCADAGSESFVTIVLWAM
jgi:hypothetical protein